MSTQNTGGETPRQQLKNDVVNILKINGDVNGTNEYGICYNNIKNDETKTKWKRILYSIFIHILFLGTIMVGVIAGFLEKNRLLFFAGFCVVVELLIIIFQARHFEKQMAACHEDLRPWRNKIFDTYAFLVDMEALLYKAKCEKEKKTIEKDSQTTIPAPLTAEEIKELVREEINKKIDSEKKKNTDVSFCVKLKND